MESKRNKTTKILIIIFAVALLIEVGYAILSTTLRINGNAKINRAGWDVHFENVQVTSGSVPADTEATIDSVKTTVNYVVTLAKPGDFYEFTVDAVNRGTIDAMISTITNTPLTPEQPKYLAYTVTYSDGTAIAPNQLLAQQKTETFKVRVEFKKDITAADLPTTPQTVTLKFSAEYVQADSTAIEVPHPEPVCKRATTLHTETCDENEVSNESEEPICLGTKLALGETVVYGNLGTVGADLVAGDAFDCDVNGDGIFDAETERFYYVSDLDTNEDYAVLAYYSNVAAGVPNNTATFEYDAARNPRENGPVTVVAQLPTIEQWSNVSLLSTTRKMKDETGTAYKADFSYTGKATRLLTYQEVETACSSITNTDASCEYLFENCSISYGYWLETIYSDAIGAWIVNNGVRGLLNGYYFGGSYGVRPAIEVPKVKIAS